MKNLLIICLLFITTGCGIFETRPELPTVITEEKTEYLVPEVTIDQYLVEDCQDLTELPYQANFSDILVVTKDNAIKYADCKDKHKSLVKLLNKSLNIKENN